MVRGKARERERERERGEGGGEKKEQKKKTSLRSERSTDVEKKEKNCSLTTPRIV